MLCIKYWLEYLVNFSFLSTRLNVYGFYEVKVSGDGNCPDMCNAVEVIPKCFLLSLICFSIRFVHFQIRFTSQLNTTNMFGKKSCNR
jgi:hypothetical protein